MVKVISLAILDNLVNGTPIPFTPKRFESDKTRVTMPGGIELSKDANYDDPKVKAALAEAAKTMPEVAEKVMCSLCGCLRW